MPLVTVQKELEAGGAVQTQTAIDMINKYQLHSPHSSGDKFFADHVKELPKGDVIITLHAGASLDIDYRLQILQRT